MCVNLRWSVVTDHKKGCPLKEVKTFTSSDTATNLVCIGPHHLQFKHVGLIYTCMVHDRVIPQYWPAYFSTFSFNSKIARERERELTLFYEFSYFTPWLLLLLWYKLMLGLISLIWTLFIQVSSFISLRSAEYVMTCNTVYAHCTLAILQPFLRRPINF